MLLELHLFTTGQRILVGTSQITWIRPVTHVLDKGRPCTAIYFGDGETIEVKESIDHILTILPPFAQQDPGP